MYYIGIDLGTSAVKLLLVRDDGVIINSVSKEYPLSFPRPGWSEQTGWSAPPYCGTTAAPEKRRTG